MKTVIQCEKTRLGDHAFYIMHNRTKYLLFVQKYYQDVNNVFSNGIDLNKAINPKTAKGAAPVSKTIDKMKLYIKYIEKEYQVKILDASINKGVRNKRKELMDKYKNSYNWY